MKNYKIINIIGYSLLLISLWLTFISAYLIKFQTTYLIGLFLFLALFFLNQLSPRTFLIIITISFLLFIISPSPTFIVSFFPLFGFLFAKEPKFKCPQYFQKYLTTSIYFFIILYLIFVSENSNASHNYLSILILYGIIAEYLLFETCSKFYIPLIIFCFLIIGNRSSIFLLMIFMRSKFTLLIFFSIAISFIAMTIGKIEIFKNFQILFEEGGLLNRSYGETRGDYIDEFSSKFNFLNLSYNNWNFKYVPQTSNGFYDLHNSFLTIIVRDSYLGLFKIFLWTLQIFFLPIGFFTGISMRSYYDTFLLGGVNDILLYALIGKNIRKFLLNINKYKR
jgi:hypothetical protein